MIQTCPILGSDGYVLAPIRSKPDYTKGKRRLIRILGTDAFETGDMPPEIKVMLVGREFESIFTTADLRGYFPISDALPSGMAYVYTAEIIESLEKRGHEEEAAILWSLACGKYDLYGFSANEYEFIPKQGERDGAHEESYLR